MARIFLSYSRDDGLEVAKELGNRLLILRHDVFQDIHGIPGGVEWEKELIRRAKWCDLLVILVTESSNKSEWVFREFREAEKNGKRIVPLRVNNADIPPYLRQLQAIPLSFIDDNNNTLDGAILRLIPILDNLGNSRGGTKRLLAILVILALIVVIVLGVILMPNDDNIGDPTEGNNEVTEVTEEIVPSPSITVVPSNTPTPEVTATPSHTLTITPTRTPRPTRTPIPAGAVLMDEDLEDTVATGFIPFVLISNWSILDDGTGNYVLAVSKSIGYPQAYFGSTTWQNYVLEFRVRWLDCEPEGCDSIWVKFRQVGGAGYNLSLVPKNNLVSLGYEVRNQWLPLINRNYSLNRNDWYKVRLEVNSDQFLVFINDSNVPTLNINNTRYERGRLELGVDPNTHVQFDDIKVIYLGDG